ncbi:hypothetical protein Tco_0855232, partial [Tanacetum coccineum]
DSTEHQILGRMLDHASYHAQAHKGFCYDEYELVIGYGCNKQWLQLLPIETWELSRISSLYVLLPPVSITSFNNAILLRSSRNRLLMKYSNTFKVFGHNLVDEFRSIICANESDCFVEANLYLLKKVGDKT